MAYDGIQDENTYKSPGQIVLFGSGETSSSGRKIFEEIFRFLPFKPKVVLLETPAGFEPNSHKVANKVSDFLSHSLQNYLPNIEILPARKRGTYFSPDNPEIVDPILSTDMVFMGPGSPTYAVRQLKGSLAWDYILARNMLGASLVLASSAVVAAGTFALPVYEIYKVGDDLHWNDGLDLFTGMNVVFVPHWNNQDGGSELDTSCCFVGKERFAQLLEMLPQETTVIGIDEHTAVFLDFNRSIFQVLGKGKMTVIQPGIENCQTKKLGETLDAVIHDRQSCVSFHERNSVISIDRIFPKDYSRTQSIISESIWLKARTVANELAQKRGLPSDGGHVFMGQNEIPLEIERLLDQRRHAREQKKWGTSDKIRELLLGMGWEVLDTLEGQKVTRSKLNSGLN